MEALFAFNGQTDLAPNGTMHNDAPASSVTEPQPWTDPQPPTEPQPPTQTVDSLREALEAAHVRIAYFERFGPWIEQQMSAVVEVGDRSKIVTEMRGAPGGAGRPPSNDEGGGGVLGVTVRSLSHEQAQKLSDTLHLGSLQGVRVTEVKPDTFAEELGLQSGDVVLSINRQPVSSVDEFERLQAQLKSGADVLLLVARPNEGTFSTLFLADRLP